MQKYQSIISGTNGSVIRNVPVTVLKEDGSLAEIFLDREGQVPAPNPLATDSRGVFYFYAKNGRYSLRTAADGVQITDADTVLLFDPDETVIDGPIADAVRRAEDAAERAETALSDSGLQTLVQNAQNAASDASQAVADVSQAVVSINTALAQAGEAKEAAQAAAQTASNAASGAQAVKDSLLTYSGTLSATPEWSAVPAHEDLGLDAQTQAALNRVEKLKDDQQLLKQRADKSVLSYPDYAAASAAAATLPDGQAVHAPNAQGDPSRYYVQDGLLVFQGALRSTVNVKDFCAVGDGVTDDTEAFTKALAASTYEVHVPDGTYVIGGLIINGKRLSGSGVIKWKAGATSACITLAGDKPSLRGLTFDGNASEQTANLIMVETSSAANAEIYGCVATNGRYKFFRTDVGASPGARIEANAFYNWGTQSGCNVIDLRSSRGIVTGNSFRGIGVGHCVRIGVYESDPATPVIGCVVSGNTFTNTEHVGVCLELYAQGVVISGNSFDGLQQGVKIESGGYTAFDISITGNYFANLTINTAFNLTGAQVTFTGNVCVNCVGGVDIGPRSICSNNIVRNCGNVANSMPSIRAASNAPDCLITGNYVENAPYRGISLGPRNVCSNNVVVNANSYGIHTGVADSTLSGNKVVGGTHGIVLSSTGVNASITGNRVSGASVTNYSIDTAARLTAYIDTSNLGYSPTAIIRALVSGVITVPRQNMAIVVDTEASAATGDLTTINVEGGGFFGQIIVLRCNTGFRVVTVKDSSGIRLAGDFALTNTDDTLTLMWNGSYWMEVSRSDNA